MHERADTAPSPRKRDRAPAKRAEDPESYVDSVDDAIASSNQGHRRFEWVNEKRQSRCKTEMRQQRQEQEPDERGGRKQQGVHRVVAGGNGCAKTGIDDAQAAVPPRISDHEPLVPNPIHTMAIVSAAASAVRLTVRVAR